jgi:ribose/xylose/arabinose/galactoside ABC-type transport system permease subunit
LVLLIVLVIAGSLLSDVFLTPRNLLNILLTCRLRVWSALQAS